MTAGCLDGGGLEERSVAVDADELGDDGVFELVAVEAFAVAGGAAELLPARTGPATGRGSNQWVVQRRSPWVWTMGTIRERADQQARRLVD